MDFEQAKQAFELYLNGYDRKDEKVYLKIVHTYGVVDCSEEIARRMGLGEEDIFLAKIIALLHDIGRFEQLKLYDSFEPGIFDHAQYGADILFREGRIREFLPETTWDETIETAIRYHSAFQLPKISDSRTLLHAELPCEIRGAGGGSAWRSECERSRSAGNQPESLGGMSQ